MVFSCAYTKVLSANARNQRSDHYFDAAGAYYSRVCCRENENALQRGPASLSAHHASGPHVTLRYVTSRAAADSDAAARRWRLSYAWQDFGHWPGSVFHTHRDATERKGGGRRGGKRKIKTVMCGLLQTQNSSMYYPDAFTRSIIVYDVVRQQTVSAKIHRQQKSLNR